MGKKRQSGCQMNMKSSWVGPCGVLMGLSCFLRIVCYFGLINLLDLGFFEVIFQMGAPILLAVVFVALLRAARLNAPGIYAIIGAAMCLMVILWNFTTGDVLRIILSVFGYGLAGTALIGSVAGFVPGRLLPALFFLICLVVRVLAYTDGLGIISWVLEVSTLSMLCSLFCLCWCLKPNHRKRDIPESE